MGHQTPLYQKHLESGAKIVDFGGWDMPINYGSQIQEHNAVRTDAGIFDVSHMTVVDISGPDSKAYLQYLLCNDVEKLEPGKALYSAMLNEEGGVVDDLIVYLLSDKYRMVVNCGTREKDLQWMRQHSERFSVQILERPKLAILAVHGPQSIEKVCSVLATEKAKLVKGLKNFRGIELDDWFIARTGYTGEQGLEIIFPGEQAADFWDSLLQAGIAPVGLGARDTLRLEAGMNLYGHDMDESISPLAANMEQTIAWDPSGRQFIGRASVEQHKVDQDDGKIAQLVGLVLKSRGVLREGQKVLSDLGEGIITSGSFSPTLKHSIALARIPYGSQTCEVDLRGKWTTVSIVKPNFVRFGAKVFE